VSSSLQDQLQTALGQAYLLERELGGGGMSRVFLSLETALGRKVVVKVLLPELAAGVNVDRFRREIQLAAQLQHPHIVPLLSAGEAEGLPYFIMPFVTGESLRARMAREGELPVSETVRILRDIVSALAYAHARGIVHRDVKPDNVLLSGGVAVVTDFGVAKAVSASTDIEGAGGVTSLGVALGTPMYMAPEQATASPQIDHRADLYALGVLTYEMLTGQPPFAGRSPQAVLAAHVVEEPPPVESRRPAVPSMLATLVNECLAKRPADRPQSATEVLHVLDAIGTPSGGTAPTTAVRVGPVHPSVAGGRRWLLFAALAAVVTLVVAGALLLRPAAYAPVSSLAGPTPVQPALTPTPADSAPAAGPAPAAPPPVAAATPEAQQPAAEPKGGDPRAVERRRPAAGRPAPAREATPPGNGDAAKPTAVPPPVTLERIHPDSLPAPFADSATHIRSTEPRVDSAGPVAPAAPPARAPAPVPSPTPAAPPAAGPRPASPPPAADPRPAIQGVVAEYAAAVESESLEGLRGVYPLMTPAQAQGWEQFFTLVRDVKAQLTVSRLEVANGTAEAQVAGTYTYLNTSTQRGEHQPVSFRATFRRDGDRWRIFQIH
jgi:tRNA A-37 threonylcarbamoyl transferase component Bud32